MKDEIKGGVVHELPEDVEESLRADEVSLDCWQKLTPLARNEWICWIGDAKKDETRIKRKSRMLEELREGKKRPCCWPGCPHRSRG